MVKLDEPDQGKVGVPEGQFQICLVGGFLGSSRVMALSPKP